MIQKASCQKVFVILVPYFIISHITKLAAEASRT